MLSKSLPDWTSDAPSLSPSEGLDIPLEPSNLDGEDDSVLVGVNEKADDLMLPGDNAVSAANGCPAGNMPAKFDPIG